MGGQCSWKQDLPHHWPEDITEGATEHVGSHRLPWGVLVLPPKVDLVLDDGGPYITVPLHCHWVHLRDLHWGTICFITLINWTGALANLVWKNIRPSFKKINLKRKIFKDRIETHIYSKQTFSLYLELRGLCKKTSFHQTLPFMVQNFSSRVQACASTFRGVVCLFGFWAVTQPRILWEYTKTIFFVTVLCFSVSRFCPNFNWQFIKSSSHIILLSWHTGWEPEQQSWWW